MIIWGANSFQFINFSSVKLTWTSSWSSNAVQSRHKKYNAPHCLQIRAWPLTGQNYSPYQRELVMMLFINQSWLENLFTAVKLEQWTTIWRLAHILGHRNGTGRADLLRLIFGAACHFPFFFLFLFSFIWLENTAMHRYGATAGIHFCRLKLNAPHVLWKLLCAF